MSRRGPSKGGSRRRVRLTLIAVVLLSVALTVPARAVEAGSARAFFTVSATVIAKCASRGLSAVCTKGAAPPRIETVGTPGTPASVQRAPSPSASGQRQTMVVTVNY